MTEPEEYNHIIWHGIHKVLVATIVANTPEVRDDQKFDDDLCVQHPAASAACEKCWMCWITELIHAEWSRQMRTRKVDKQQGASLRKSLGVSLQQRRRQRMQTRTRWMPDS